ncbi:hypothetical protein MB46_19550 (plasmid) [Arthrobacter alpinus]|uniref:hypothetical protein n=1 Tax=Arthrobacter alpinus TaxID=656366 RepID=UPI0005C7F915|nr:hypothetical protein [Arthrobacter alpinus]ALV47868.1 hypothetical protein MB46_19550 [Arthrobacter alpinus]
MNDESPNSQNPSDGHEPDPAVQADDKVSPVVASTSLLATEAVKTTPKRLWAVDAMRDKRWGWGIIAGIVVVALVACSFILGGFFKDKSTADGDVAAGPLTTASTPSASDASATPTLQAGLDKQAAGDPLGSAEDIRKRQALVRKGINQGVNGLHLPIETSDPIEFAGAFAMAVYGFDSTAASADEYFDNLWQWYTPYTNPARPKWNRDALSQSQSEELQRPAYEMLKSRSMINDVVVDTAYIDDEIAGLGASQLPFPVGASVPGGKGSHLIVVALDVQAYSTEKQAPQDTMPIVPARQQKIVQMVVLCPGFAGYTGSSCKAVYESSSADAWYTNLEKEWIFHS